MSLVDQAAYAAAIRHARPTGSHRLRRSPHFPTPHFHRRRHHRQSLGQLRRSHLDGSRRARGNRTTHQRRDRTCRISLPDNGLPRCRRPTHPACRPFSWKPATMSARYREAQERRGPPTHSRRPHAGARQWLNAKIFCTGCTACAMRCTDGIKISEFEFTRIAEELRRQEPFNVRRVVVPGKAPHLVRRHAVYRLSVLRHQRRPLPRLRRPPATLTCRLFGHIRHLPCPIERIPADLDAAHIIEAYTAQSLFTFTEWMAPPRLFQFRSHTGRSRNAALF